jgi:hypothetical protein
MPSGDTDKNEQDNEKHDARSNEEEGRHGPQFRDCAHTRNTLFKQL